MVMFLGWTTGGGCTGSSGMTIAGGAGAAGGAAGGGACTGAGTGAGGGAGAGAGIGAGAGAAGTLEAGALTGATAGGIDVGEEDLLLPGDVGVATATGAVEVGAVDVDRVVAGAPAAIDGIAVVVAASPAWWGVGSTEASSRAPAGPTPPSHAAMAPPPKPISASPARTTAVILVRPGPVSVAVPVTFAPPGSGLRPSDPRSLVGASRLSSCGENAKPMPRMLSIALIANFPDRAAGL